MHIFQYGLFLIFTAFIMEKGENRFPNPKAVAKAINILLYTRQTFIRHLPPRHLKRLAMPRTLSSTTTPI